MIPQLPKIPEVAPIVTKGLFHYFNHYDARIQALSDIHLEISRGRLTILMDP